VKSNTLDPDRPRHLCYRPTVFFRHLCVIALSFPQEKLGALLQTVIISVFFLRF
jgi:hypothetical protein